MSNKIWGGRFKKELDPLTKKFNSSLCFDYVLYQDDILGSQIHVKMLAKQQIISQEESKIIFNALDDIKDEIANGKHKFDDTHEDIHMFIEYLLIEKTGDIGKKLHTGRSRNDQVALDMRLYTRRKGLEIELKLNILIHTLQSIASKYKDIMMPGYTHLQQAQPIAIDIYLGAYIAMFTRDKCKLNTWYKTMNYSPLGAGSFAGSKLPLDREYVAKNLDFNGIIDNTIDAVSDRDYIIELCSIISIIMMHLSRLSEDFIIWATKEFNFIELDDAFATGSSLMPNKKNPDILELIRGKTGRTFGNLMSILTVMKGIPLAYNKDMQEDKECIFDSIETVLISLEIISPFLNSLKFNVDAMDNAANSGYLSATSVLEELVKKNIPFRDAHHMVGSWIAESIEKNISFAEILEIKNKNSDNKIF